MEEQQYLELMTKVLNSNNFKPNRTPYRTKSIFGNYMKFTLREGDSNILPLLTTKKVHYKSIIEELLWFISGSTDAKVLSSKGVKIWDENSSKKNLEKLGKNYREGDIGPGYGFQWRHFGATYENCDKNYENEGIDQLMQSINMLKNDPYSRRNIVTAWNPVNIKDMVLPPCHIFFQFNMDAIDENDPNGQKYLDCKIDQRSADIPLGMPFNIASYAFLTHMVAQQVDAIPRNLIYTTGDNHIYENQIEKCYEQISRTPKKFPTLELIKAENIESYTYENFIIKNYEHDAAIKFPFTV